MADPRKARQLAKEGIQLAREGNVKEALPRLQQAVQLDDQFAEGWFWLAYFTQDTSKQIDYLNRSLALKPDYERARELLSRIEPQATTDATDDDDPFADLDIPSQPSSGSGVAMPQVDVGGAIADVRSQFTGENRRKLLEAWRSALMFDSEKSYETYRGRTNPITTAILVALIFALSPLVLLILVYLLNGGGGDFGDFVEFLLRLFFGSLLLGVQTVIAFYAASATTAFVARLRFESEVSTNEQFGLSGLYFIPLTLLIVVGLALVFIFLWLLDTLGISTRNFSPALSYTPFAVFIFFIAHTIFSNVAIHRVKSWPAVMLTIAENVVFGLVFAWLLPITAPFISDALVF